MDKNKITQAVNSFLKIEIEEREIERLSDELAKQVQGLTEKEMVAYVTTTQAFTQTLEEAK